MDPETLQQLGLTEDQIAQLMQLGVLAGEQDIVTRERELANRLRNRRGPQGRFSGRAYTKAHPLEHLASGIDRTIAGINERTAAEQQRENLRRQAEARQSFLNAFLKNRQIPQGTQTTATMAGRPPMPAAQTAPYRPTVAANPLTWTPIAKR